MKVVFRDRELLEEAIVKPRQRRRKQVKGDLEKASDCTLDLLAIRLGCERDVESIATALVPELSI